MHCTYGDTSHTTRERQLRGSWLYCVAEEKHVSFQKHEFPQAMKIKSGKFKATKCQNNEN